VLVVDNEEIDRELLVQVLQPLGFELRTAASGHDALDLLASGYQPDALDESGYTVLLDAMMPGMDSFEVPRQLKLMPQTAHIPIIFMTGLTETEHLEAGGVDYVNKPLKPKEVLARMQVHLPGARARRQARSALDAFGYASITSG